MEDDQEVGESISLEELEVERNRLLALKEALGSGDESSDESEGGGGDERSESDEESSSFEDNSLEEGENSEKEEEDEEMGCPAKRRKLDESSDDEDLTQQPSEGHELGPEAGNGEAAEADTSTEEATANSMKRLKRIPEYPSPEFVLPLPQGWIYSTHDSGVPIYMHLDTRVVTFSRPYELKKGESFRRHPIPLASVPCEQQRRMTAHRNSARVQLPGTTEEVTVPQVQLRTMEELREERLTAEELYERAKETFCIKEIMVFKHNDWKTIREAKKKEAVESAMMEESTVDMDQNPMLTVAAGCGAHGRKIKKRGYILNVVGKTSVALLHEYVPKVLKGALEYTFTEVKSSINPYSAMCHLKTKKETAVRKQHAEDGDNASEDDAVHRFLIGRGSGDSRKKAKRMAASEALRNLIPGIKINENNVVTGNAADKESMEAFDMLAIDDEKVIEYSKRIGRQLPYAILLESIRMNAAWGATKPEESNVRIAHSRYELTMKVGKHETTVECTSLKDGRHRAAQALLKKLHPGMDTWGSIFRLFSSSANDDLHETKRVRDQVVRLAPNIDARDYARNDAVLEALRSEMRRAGNLMEKRREREVGLKDSQPVVKEEMQEGRAGPSPEAMDF